MPRLSARRRAELPASAFAYIDGRGRRRLPIHDEAHVRNALARFTQVAFESDEARERARRRLLNAAKKVGIVPVGFITRQLQSESRHAAAGRLVIELGAGAAPGALEERLRRALRDPTLAVYHWSETAKAYLDAQGRPAALPTARTGRTVTYLERLGRPMIALSHARTALADPELAKLVMDAVRFVLERDQSRGQVSATATAAAALPAGFVTLMMTDIERSTLALQRLGERYAQLLADIRGTIRAAVRRVNGQEIDARADEFFAVFRRPEDALRAAAEVQRRLHDPSRPSDLAARVRIGLHSGRPTLTETGYIGMPVHTTARVCAAAHGGQILATGEVKTATRSAPGGVRFRRLGRHPAPGLPAAVALYHVVVDGLPARFPPPRGAR
jgi:class 3 adenylate cyclase